MKVAVMAGDGIGPEIVAQAVKVLKALEPHGISMEMREGLVGAAAYDATGDPLPPESQELAAWCDAILFGSVGGFEYEHLGAKRPGQGLLRLRKDLELFANIRPASVFSELKDASPLRAEIIEGLDLVIVRELTGDLYFGQPRGICTKDNERVGYNTMVYAESEVERIAHVAFRTAMTRKRRVCSVDKANVLEAMQLWRETVEKVAREYPQVELTHMYVDAAAMMLVREPTRFDVMLTPNLFGDILSDVASMLSGSIGMIPSASIGGTKKGLYEPIHGSAPDIAGQNIANPVATILSAAMMLRLSLDCPQGAERIEKAVGAALAQGYRTADIARPGDKRVGTSEMGDAIAAAI
ncbi:3-isopropylmalate dehydrogenase [Afifella sp. IM 167]|uniref:3-isopropylmalate dehydrogenase n=1 Tax=Afifella sp. IM 167 TaxID=2033586 RepID=UPI001CCBE631|nr:3-isopropylmalate dehydrogenase [Afifella sp. IM 167]MBZ8134782.1 3-isopropylmalate dehydrogenase [Afifella sp. IM 167]